MCHLCVSVFPVSQQCRCGLARTCGKHQHRGDETSIRDQLLWRGSHDQRSNARHEEEAFRTHHSHEQCYGSSGYDLCVINNIYENQSLGKKYLLFQKTCLKKVNYIIKSVQE